MTAACDLALPTDRRKPGRKLSWSLFIAFSLHLPSVSGTILGPSGFTREATSGRTHMLAPESVLAWIVIGAIAGWLAGLLVKGYGFGLIGNVVVGILGAGVAGLLAPRLGPNTQSFGGNVIASLLGALVLLFLFGLVRRT